MTSEEFKKELLKRLVPSKYKKVVTKGIPESWLVLEKGDYVFACLPFSDVPSEDYRNTHVKGILRKSLKAVPVLFEKGVFIVYYGTHDSWIRHYPKFKVDKTALRPIIIQSIHFFDTETGDNINLRTSWGPVKFGFCGSTIKQIESIGETVQA